MKIDARSEGIWQDRVSEAVGTARSRLRRRGVPADQAEELVQAALFQVVEREARRGWSHVALPGLLRTIAWNIWLDARRRHTRHPWVELDDGHAATTGGTPEDLAASREALRVCHGAIRAMAARDRDFLLDVVDGVEVAAAGARHGIGRSRAYERLARIRARLRLRLAET